MKRFILNLATLAIFVVASARVGATEWDDCMDSDPDRRIAACTHIVISGQETGTKLAATYANRGLAYSAKGDHERAIADMDEAIRLNPYSALIHNSRGHLYSARGDHDRAISDYSEAIRLDAKYADAYTNRGNAYRAIGELDRAIADYDQAIQIDPVGIIAAISFYNRAHAYFDKGDHDHAISDYSTAIRFDSKFADAHINRGLVYSAKGEHERAIADMDEAIRIEPANMLAYLGRGFIYRATGERDREIADYRKILELPAQSAADRRRQEIARERISRLSLPGSNSPISLPERRIALVIGNSKYTHAGPLSNPQNDARAVALALRRLGFEVIDRYDLSLDAMTRAIKNVGDRAEGAEWAIVYFAGHGIEMNGTNYLIPTDAELKRDSHVADETVSLDRILAKVDGASKLGLVILDACRNNPFLARMARTGSSGRSIGQGLANIEPEGNILVAYSARHGTVAEDGSGEHSPFTESLLAHIEEPGLEINFLFRRIRDEVRRKTQRRQEPFLYGSLGSDLLFFRKVL